MPADFLIQHINLNELPNQAVEYCRGLVKKMTAENQTAETVSCAANLEKGVIERMLAGKHEDPNSVMIAIWKSPLEWHPEPLILAGSGWEVL